MLNDNEKKLLRQQAEAYAFIYDLRRLAIKNGDRAYILMTHGVEDTIEKRKAEYPRLFQRYFQAALQRAEQHRDGKKKEKTENTATKEQKAVVFTREGRKSGSLKKESKEKGKEKA